MNKVCIQTIQVFAVADIQSLSHVWLFATPQTAAHQASMSFTIFWSLLKLMSIESVIPPNHVVLCHPFLLLPSIFPSNRGFSNDSALCIRWLKYWSFSFIVSPSNEYLGLIKFCKNSSWVGPLMKISEFSKDVNTTSCSCPVFSISGVK